jgi:hypothetical protein
MSRFPAVGHGAPDGGEGIDFGIKFICDPSGQVIAKRPSIRRR